MIDYIRDLDAPGKPIDKFPHTLEGMIAIVYSGRNIRCPAWGVGILDIPVICWQRDSSEDLIATDMTFKLTAERGYKEPIDIEVIKQPGNKTFHIKANESSLKYSEHLKDCPKLWFYEEK